MREIIRFAMVGALATTVQYVIYVLFLYLGMTPLPSFTISYAISWLLNFLLSARFTFRSKATLRRGIGFAASHAFNYLLQAICLKVVLLMGCMPSLAPLPVWSVCIPLNFLMVRWVFRNK